MIVIVESLELVQHGVRVMIGNILPGNRILTCASMSELQSHSAGESPALVLISLLKDVNGEGTEHITVARDIFPQSPLIAYGQDLVPDVIRFYYMAGINGYFSLTGSELEECVRTVMEGKTYFNSAMVDSFIFHLQARNRNVPGPTLTAKQYQVAYMVAKGMSLTRIAELLGVKAATVSITKAKIFSKLGVVSVRELQQKLNYFSSPE